MHPIKPIILEEGKDYYILPDGRLVFTAAYLAGRGHCCGNGCLNCPYNFMNVPEPKHTLLLKLRKPDESSKER